MKLLFELDRKRGATIAAVLQALDTNERDFFLANPQCLGVRCEAHLAHVAPEWFEANGYLSDADRATLGALVLAATSDSVAIVSPQRRAPS
jgi:hypothetical protein